MLSWMKKHPLFVHVKKAPLMLQLEALECGAACLGMVLAAYDTWVPLEQLRQDCGVSRDGSKALNIVRAAEAYGMEAHGFKMDIPALKEGRVPFPCILFWNFNHFVVLNGFKGEPASINDPGRGHVWVDAQEFSQSYTGICLGMLPGPTYTPQGQKPSVLKGLLSQMSSLVSTGIYLLLLTVTLTLITLLQLGLQRIFLDVLLPGKVPEAAVPFFITMAVLIVVQLALMARQALYTLRIQGALMATGSSRFLWHVLHLPQVFFSQRLPGDLVQRKAAYASLSYSLLQTLMPLALQVVLFAFYLVVMVRYSPLLSVLGLGALALNVGLSFIMAKQRNRYVRVGLRDQAQLSTATITALTMVETIKAAGAEEGFFERWAGYQANLHNTQMQVHKKQLLMSTLPTFINSLSQVAILGTGVYLTLNGQFTVGMILAFQGYLGAVSAPATALMQAHQAIQEAQTNMERINDVMNYPQDIQVGVKAPYSAPKHKLTGAIELTDVNFTYSPLEPPFIKNFSLSVTPGQSIALVGSSGCGKSTLTKLIAGLVQPQSGSITIDGTPLQEIDYQVLTGSLAVVDQDITLFKDTLAHNIKLWDSTIEDYEVILAARDAAIHDDIMARPLGYKHPLQERGQDFSGGQRQRIEIARALAQDPTILILDEATSALDAQTEAQVIDAIRQRGITTIIVAHRLSTIRHCDCIYVLDHGVLAEKGTHSELMAQDGVYARLIAQA